MKVVQSCLDAAKPFGNFMSRDCFYDSTDEVDGDENDHNTSSSYRSSSNHKKRRWNRRNVCVKYIGCSDGESLSTDYIGNTSCLLAFSKVAAALKASLDIEIGCSFAPPPAISFGDYSTGS